MLVSHGIHRSWHGAIVVLAGSTVVAQVVTIETVPVRNLCNTGELSGKGAGGFGPDRICGAVDYGYNIGRYEVTAGQYCEFLNAVAKTDAHGLYDSRMDSDPLGCQITRHGKSGSYTYDFSGGTVERSGSTAAYWANRVGNYVSWGDAARFANWLHNGQGSGDTESGAYTLDGNKNPENDVDPFIQRESGATWALPSYVEWYKAGFYDPRDVIDGGVSDGGGFWTVAT